MLDALQFSLNKIALLGFIIYMGTAALLFSLYQFIYTRLTPHKEFRLIRENNVAAAVGLGGTLVGYAIPAGNIISYSANLLDFVVWALIAAVVQLLAFFITHQVIRDLPGRIQRGEMAAAIYTAAVAISVGLLNAACMTPSNG